ncbi:cysteine-rich protein 2-like [Acanthaster planci]|uniref:Cysteine-rich protein 1 n=1 Tax=Acanthaster planci TaxID=133434 RepID=A0A8B7ZCN0_ACAPL|nr:cysteine-rich protein 2-like [Acanthaster planci]
MANPCAGCTKPVYFAERLVAMNRDWHKICFKCADCKQTLTPGKQNVHDDKPYCRTCYGRNFGPKGYSSGNATAVNSYVTK